MAVRVDRNASLEELEQDWHLRHELIHLSHPSLSRHRWFEEGLAVYAEFAMRLANGHLSPKDFWEELQDRIPESQENRTGGLDDSGNLSHIYWGGTLYFLLADMEIRLQTDNRRSIHDAIRSWHKQGGNVSVAWDIERTLSVADRATGTKTLSALYQRIGRGREQIDLNQLWSSLRDSRVKEWIEAGDSPMTSSRP